MNQRTSKKIVKRLIIKKLMAENLELCLLIKEIKKITT